MLESAGILLTETEVPFFDTSVSKTVVGMLGTANKGPLNSPQLITTLDEFINTFGDVDENSFGSYAAYQYLRNGNRLWYCRVGNGATQGATSGYSYATASFTDVKFSAISTGEWGNKISIRFVNGTGPNTFHLEVYYRNSKGRWILREYWKDLTLVETVPNFIENILGTRSGSVITKGGSNYIVAEHITSTTTRPSATSAGAYNVLTQGQSGLSPSTSEVVGTSTNGVNTGLQCFSSLEDMDINVVCAPGFTSDDHVDALIALAEARGDVLALVDPPLGLSVSDMVSWQLNYTSSRAAVHWPWVELLSPDNSRSVFVPPSTVVASQMAYNDRVGFPWYAPAGWNRGLITNAIGVEYNTTLADRDMLQSDNNSVNPILFVRNRGVVLWGQKTLAHDDVLVNRINVRRLVIYLRKEIGKVASNLLFEPNDPSTWLRFRMMAEPVLSGVKNTRGIEEYRIRMDKTTITDEDIRNNTMNGIIYIKPIESAEFINLNFTLTPTGVSFDSLY